MTDARIIFGFKSYEFGQQIGLQWQESEFRSTRPIREDKLPFPPAIFTDDWVSLNPGKTVGC